MEPDSSIASQSETGPSPVGRGRRHPGTARIALAISVSTPLALGAGGGLLTAGAITGWYDALIKPAWTPPSWLFGPVWTVLYVTMGVAAWRVWRRGRFEAEMPTGRARVHPALVAYGVQLGLNAAWSPVFFGLKRVDLALAVILLMLAAIVETIRRFRQIDRPAAILMLPYLAWVSFATVLNATIWSLNR